jgi:Cysteine-rich secretory protein family
MQVALSLRRVALGRVALAALVAAQLVQPARVSAQENDFANEAQKVLNDVRTRLPNCQLLSSNQAFVVPVASNLNATRPSLTWNNRLAQIAKSHSEAMARDSFFDHVDLAGKTVANRAKEAGYNYRVVAENIAAGQDTLPEVVMEWIASQGHCENMIDSRVTEFGLAKVRASNPLDPFSSYWTLVLGTPKK